MDVQLTPPIGTCYFKLYTVPLSEAGKFTLNVTFYVYVTNVKPTDENFTAKGGKVYIVIVYDGSVIQSTKETTHINLLLTDKTGDSSLFSSIQQLPVLGSGVKEGDYTFYTINFGQTMNMYNNGGNSAFQFSARYKKDFSLYKFVQEPFQLPPEFWGFRLVPLEKVRTKEPTVNSLQVFETNRLTIATLGLTFTVVDPEPRADLSEREHNFDPAIIDLNNPSTTRASVTFDLDFSADTMARAVVGGRTKIQPNCSNEISEERVVE